VKFCFLQMLQTAQSESSGFTATRTCLGNHVGTGKHMRQCSSLDRRHLVIAETLQLELQLRAQFKSRK